MSRGIVEFVFTVQNAGAGDGTGRIVRFPADHEYREFFRLEVLGEDLAGGERWEADPSDIEENMRVARVVAFARRSGYEAGYDAARTEA